MTIRLLPQNLINQIAAGEVIERPASVIKELVENALDAGATQIRVSLREGGAAHMAVQDNGCGMSKEDMALAIQRHATSKLEDEDLFNIHTLGFRGEALPSIGSVARLTLQSRKRGTDQGWSLQVDGGAQQAATPVSCSEGTCVQVNDLFFATPARLKFLKTPLTEQHHVEEILRRLALAHPQVGFALKNGDKEIFNYPAAAHLTGRVTQVLGQEFHDNALPIQAESDVGTLTGMMGLPTYNKSTQAHQYFFVNGRPVKDKVLQAALRVAYQDYLSKDRHAAVVLCLHVPFHAVDMNVHPAKIEVRFQEAQRIRSFIIQALRNALQQGAHQTATTLHQEALHAFKPAVSPQNRTFQWSPAPRTATAPRHISNASQNYLYEPTHAAETTRPYAPEAPQEAPLSNDDFPPLGLARAQIHDTYVVSETQDGFIVVDQHAAHERLVYERLKAQRAQGTVARQTLLIPEVIELAEAAIARLIQHQDFLRAWGLEFDAFSDKAIVVRATPALLGHVPLKSLVEDLNDLLEETGELTHLEEKLNEKLSSHACHGSIRAGRKLSLPEMNALLRDMEQVPFSGQCNHGRPTYVQLHLKDIERLFGRS